jgi:chloride channel 7
VENIMSHPPITVNQITKAGEIYDILKKYNHGGFPVVVPHKKEENCSPEEKAKLRLRKPPTFAGIVNRRHLCVLLQKKDFFVEKPLPFTRKPAGEMTLLYNEQVRYNLLFPPFVLCVLINT